MYESVTMVNMKFLRRRFFPSKMQEGTSVSQHLDKMDKMIKELAEAEKRFEQQSEKTNAAQKNLFKKKNKHKAGAVQKDLKNIECWSCKKKGSTATPPNGISRNARSNGIGTVTRSNYGSNPPKGRNAVNPGIGRDAATSHQMETTPIARPTRPLGNRFSAAQRAREDAAEVAQRAISEALGMEMPVEKREQEEKRYEEQEVRKFKDSFLPAKNQKPNEGSSGKSQNMPWRRGYGGGRSRRRFGRGYGAGKGDQQKPQQAPPAHEVTRDVKEDVVEVITVTCAKEVAKEVKFHRSYGTRLCY
ncbi:hypothetical protein NE237_030524 [Protea cynaroides]|uniref:Uncharacterized protein n=1 Tax=Protea cynaroides TaxID=273540 RepID=A0A9Q0GT75_9MAGN|nr:hypothetical protein NE237_030524 [Protea cynaroides]